ncbi:MAG: DNA translocase FtsK 4TM domain-containing protein [Thermoleophilia bacterium]|nr:DNA translocase FtsK 4TM domain-containing protein [Thermoleophilia bacterium]
MIGLALLALGLFLAVVLWLSWDGGLVGRLADDGLRILAGGAAVLLPAGLLAVGGLLVARSRLVDLRPFRTGLLVLGLSLLVAFGGGRFGLGPGSPPKGSLDPDLVREHGGVLGGALYVVLGKLLGDTGYTILALFGLVAGGLLVTGASLGTLLRHSARAGERAARHTARVARRTVEAVQSSSVTLPVTRRSAPVDGVVRYGDVVGAARPAAPPALIDQLEHDPEPSESGEGEAIPALLLEEPPPIPDDTQERLFEQPATSGDYRLPDAGVLRRSRPTNGQPARAAERTAETLVQTLAHFGIDATVIGQVSGPRVTRYELQLAPGTKVSKVSALKDDLAYGLATTEIRILAPIPGKQAVGVEVPNVAPNIVTLGDIFADLPASASPLSVWLGKDISGASVWADLARMPHILIAGTTGSGKSGCINTMLCSILLRSTPDEVRMIMIDPKRVELGLYESIPHLLTPVVSSPKRASAVLLNVVEEMERRYERMSLARARNLPELNRTLAKRGQATLPYLLVVIDELADLMMVSPQEVEDTVIRLAQKSRAVGIHLVLATQRPSVDVITGMIKANVPSRIAFAVSSQTDSRVILDTSGAEALLGQGDMLFKPLGTSRLQRVQGAYVCEEEIALIVEQCRRQRAQELDESLLEPPESARGAGDDDEEDLDPDEDPLLARAIEIVVQTQTASVSLIQRRLRVGYTRAGRLIDMLERRGVISGYEGSKPRRVLVGEHELDRALTSVREGVPG